MKGLILKDIYNLKTYGRMILLLMAGFGVMSWVTENYSFLSSFFTMFFLILTITSFSYDSYSHWEEYALTLPVTRRQIILAKYVLALVLAVLGTAASFVLTLALRTLRGDYSGYFEQFVSAFSVMLVGFVFISIGLPIIIKFGVEKSRVIAFALFVIPWLAIAFVDQMGLELDATFLETLPYQALGIGAVTAVALLVVGSYFLSCKIYQKKDI